MKIETKNGKEIRTLDDWAMLYDTPQLKHHWLVGRSAHSVAEFVLNRGGTESILRRTAEVVGEPVMFERIVPEFEQRFDEYGKGRCHDLGIFGSTKSGRSLFVGMEAKVDEPFGALVLDSYIESKARQITGTATNAPERIEELLGLHFSGPDPSMFDVRYQLLYATAGTLAVRADLSLLFVAVFKTHLYDEAIGARNFRDYIHFVSKVGGRPIKLADKGAIAHELTLGGQRLLCVHENFDL